MFIDDEGNLIGIHNLDAIILREPPISDEEVHNMELNETYRRIPRHSWDQIPK